MNVPAPMIVRLVRLRWAWLPALLLLALWLPGANAGWYRTDTHYYAAVSKHAVDSAISLGSVLPLLELMAGDQPYFNKPPLVFIIEGATIRLLGLSVWTVRLPSLLAAMALCIAAAGTARRLAGTRVAVLAGLVAATTLEVFRYTRAISLDLWQAAFVMLAVWCVASAVGRMRADRPWLVALAGVPIGLALLVKPIVALLALPILGAWLLWLGRARLAAWLPLAGLIAVAIAAPWHAFMSLRHPGFAANYFGSESLERVTQGMPGADAEPWWFYPALIGESYWPWLATAGLGAWAWMRGGADPRARQMLLLCAVWCGAWVLLLSLSAGKYTRYLLPVWPVASFLSAWWIAGLRPARGSRRASARVMLWLGPGALSLGILAALLTPGRIIHPPRAGEWDRVLEEVSRRPGVPLFTTPRAHPHAAQMVMLGRGWPPVLREGSQEQPGPRLLLDAARDAPESAAGEPDAPLRRELLVQGKDVRLFLLAD